MALANILVHLDSSPRCAVRLSLAATLAKNFGAKLGGIFAEPFAPHRVGLIATWPSENYVTAVNKARSLFEKATLELGDKASFIDVNRGGEHEILARVTDIARTFDLTILGQPDESATIFFDLAENLILESGRPVLLIPAHGDFTQVGERPLFAWRPSRVAARALADAITFVPPKAEALVVDAWRRGGKNDEELQLVANLLDAHQINVRFQHIVVDEIPYTDMIMNYADDYKADLIVFGGFDNAGFGLISRNADTHNMLRNMVIPVIISH